MKGLYELTLEVMSGGPAELIDERNAQIAINVWR